ncbi:alpha-1,2-fucosyltransferase [Paenibacillus aestuarii]|uniref:Alpha-1,2-fucosyltransferase n=1 Tax=Paenibacillus aestuarii TaxID=516965 RepID=A0ABW0K101_9BACL|nr:alpha-1,2-fucosyltransferase [Paenibacillus aestuarii]
MKIITMTQIGAKRGGRFGNQIFNYAFLNLYATYYQLKIETSPWVGQYLFDLKDPPVTHHFPSITKDDVNIDQLFKSQKPPHYNVDFRGHFHFHTSYYQPFKNQFISLFQPGQYVHKTVYPVLQRRKRLNQSWIGIHIRRGDYAKYRNHPNHWIAPTAWYLRWLEVVWPTLKNPVLFIASDDLTNILPEFRRYSPITSKEIIPNFHLDVPSKLDASIYPDYFLLTQCDFLAISNSTFSYSASMLNSNAKVFVRPDPHKRKLVTYDPWNSNTHLKNSYPSANKGQD